MKQLLPKQHRKKIFTLILFGVTLLSVITLGKQIGTRQTLFSRATSSKPAYDPKINDPNISRPGEIIVKYKEGNSPGELEQQRQERQQRASSIRGRIQNQAADMASRASGDAPVEEKLVRLDQVRERIQATEEKDLVDTSTFKDAELKKRASSKKLIKVTAKKPLTELLQELNSLPEVEYAEPNLIYQPSIIPNDPSYQYQWEMRKLGMEEAWEMTRQSYSGVLVAVLDSGVNYNDPEMVGRVINGPNFFPGENAGDVLDYWGHGTMVASLIAAQVNNNRGMAGLNRNAVILNTKVFSRNGDGAPWSSIEQAIWYAINSGVKVINFSGGVNIPCSDRPGFQQALNEATARGILFVQAAGNDSSGFVEGCQNILMVGATTDTDQRASFSDWGGDVRISAPGNYISALSHTGEVWGVYGTSFATPLVSGAAALLFAENPDMSPQHVANVLIASADPIATDQPIGPRLNVKRALESIGVTKLSITQQRNICPGGTPSIEFSWTPVSGAGTYTVYRTDPDGVMRGLGSTGQTAFGDTPPHPNKILQYTVFAIAGNVVLKEGSLDINICGGGTPSPTPTVKPTGIQEVITPEQIGLTLAQNECRGTASHIEIGWNDFSFIPGYSYVLSRRDNPNGPFEGMGTTQNRYFGGDYISNHLFTFKVQVLTNNQSIGEANIDVTSANCTPTATPTFSPTPTPRPGDIGGGTDGKPDGIINLQDYVLLFEAYGSKPGDAKWNPNADINHSGKVDVLDYVLLFENFGK